MATFSTNEVRQIIVANSVDTTGKTVGSVVGAKAFDGKIFIEYVNASGQLVKSDYIDIKKIRYAKTVPYSPHMLRRDEITIPNAGDIVAGQDYIVRILFRGWGSGSAEDQYFKFLGAYRAKTGDTAEDVLGALVESGIKNFAREDQDLLDFKLEGTGANAKMIVTEKPQEWVLGKKQGRPLNYTIQFVPIKAEGYETATWAEVKHIYVGTLGVGTGTLAADMEYFFLGERGDTYRQVGYPYTWNTKYLVDVAGEYDAIEIAYYFSDEAHAVQASEKQLVILCKRDGENSDAVSDTVVDKINTAVTAAGGTDTILTKIPNVTTVVLVGTIGTAADKSITGLTASDTYSLVTKPGEVGETISDVPANSTSITGLTNGVRYQVIKVS